DSEKKNQSNEDEDEIILHIPFNINDLKCFDKIASKKENTSTPDIVNTNIFTIADLSDNSYSDEYSDYNANEELVKKLKEKYEDKKYHVYGCFCSYNCVAAYNMDIDDYKVWDRLSLIKKLYKDVFGNDKELAMAPPRQALIKFGGILTIEDFRKNSLKNEK